MEQPIHPDRYGRFGYAHQGTMPSQRSSQLDNPPRQQITFTTPEEPWMDTQTVLGQHGAPFQITSGGKTYTLSFRTQRIKAEVERWAKQRAVRELVDLKSILPTDEYRQRMDRLLVRFDDPDDPTDVDESGKHQGGYAFSGQRVQKLMSSNDGALALFRIVLGENGAGIDEGDLIILFADKRDEIETFLRASQSKMSSILSDLGDNDDPKARMRALRAADLW